jgi:anti-sigma B factor antagonist
MTIFSPPAVRWNAPSVIGWSQWYADNCLVVTIAGELDLAVSAELRERLGEAVRSARTATIELDLAAVRFIDAHCIGLIVAAAHAARRDGRVLRVVRLRGLPAKVFALIGFDAWLTHTVPGPDACGHPNG